MSTFYLTTPIYYINGKPSIGHAYTTIAADVLARYHRLRGEEVFFLTGTDENSQKNVEAAQKVGREKDIQGYLDEMAEVWKNAWRELDITTDRFVRTTEADHLKAVETFWKAVEAKGDIYKGTYEGWYCKGCEAFVNEGDLVDGKCPAHLTEPVRIKEDNYFFRLSVYRDALLAHIEAYPDFILPKTRRNEIVSYIKDFMTDISISRSSMKWGIAVPGDESQRIYVWFDALINYLTGVGYGIDPSSFETWWPAHVHLVGKDIIKFHCALWPAMLMSAGLPLPTHVFAHGFFTMNGQKMSKSLGNTIDPLEVAQTYGNDVLRYFLLREIRFGEDGDYATSRLEERYDGELANELGNLVHRVCTMTEKYFDGMVPAKAAHNVSKAVEAYHTGLKTFALHDALEAVWSLVREANLFVEQKKPWVLAKEGKTDELAQTMYILLELTRVISVLLLPFMPQASQKILVKLSCTPEAKETIDVLLVWGRLEPGTAIAKGDPLFPRREIST
jgi:methionyl-tRNA synthetase